MPRRANCKIGSRSGLTLIEVLIAAAILGVGLTALLTAASRCLAVIHVSRRYQDVQWTLNMGELEHPLLPTDDEKDWEVSDETYDQTEMTYSRTVEPADEEHEDGLFILRSRVTWSVRGREGFEEVVRYVFVPEKAET